MNDYPHQKPEDLTDLLFERHKEATPDVLLGVDRFNVFWCLTESERLLLQLTSSLCFETRRKKIFHAHIDSCVCKRRYSASYFYHHLIFLLTYFILDIIVLD